MEEIEKIKMMSDTELHLELRILTDSETAADAEKFRDWVARNVIEPPTYLCTDLNAIAEVEKLVMEKVGFTAYADKLLQIGRRKLQEQNEAVFDVRKFLISTTARQRAEACYLALQGDK